MKPTGQQVANAAIAAATRVPPILYSQEDCQQFIEATIYRAGGTPKDYLGSNDMYRNACTNVIPLGEAIAGRKLVPGMALFIVGMDGGEPAKYKDDGKGNASHVGWYTGGIYEVVHSSSSNGQVSPSTLKNGWTHAGWLKEVDYGEAAPEQPSAPAITIAYIDLPADETVFHRISPKSSSKWWGRIRGQEQVELVSVSGGWARVRYGGHDGYVMAEFVAGNAPETDVMPPVTNDTHLDNTYLMPYIKAVETALTALKTALGI